LKSLLYTGRSERRHEEPQDIKPLFDEVEDEAGAPGAEASEDDDSLSTGESTGSGDGSRRRGKRKPLPDHLQRVRKIIDLPMLPRFAASIR
jgi:hypothetical protein